MPRDEWASAITKDRVNKALRSRRHENRKSRKQNKKLNSPQRLASRFSQNSYLWFGKYANQQIKAVPASYLQFLIANHTPGLSWRTDGLVLFLKSYIADKVDRQTIYAVSSPRQQRSQACQKTLNGDSSLGTPNLRVRESEQREGYAANAARHAPCELTTVSQVRNP